MWKLLESGCTKKRLRNFISITCAVILVPGSGGLHNCAAQQPTVPATQVVTQSPAPQDATPAGQEEAKIPAEQLDMLVAPIALYPDPLLSQTLVASTYPLELIQLQQWLEKNKGLADKALVDAVSKQSWDASIQAMAALPDLVKRLADDIQWTTDLGNAFLAQQPDVMDAIQRMRKKAQDKGNLKSGEQQKVETKVVENKTVIVVEQSSPEVVYVPSYNPTVVYGDPYPHYPYPPIYYPPAGYYAAGMAISFGVGLALGAAWGGGGWGWGCGWGNNDININRNNTFVRNTNVGNIGNRNNISGGNKWQHNPTHRGGAPYSNRATANKYGGTARGDSLNNRQSNARQQVGQQGGNLKSNRDVGNRGGVGDRGGAGDRGGVGDRGSVGDRGGVNDRGGVGDRGGVSDRGGAGNRGDVGNRGGVSDRGGAGGGDRVGSRDVSKGSSGRDKSAFGGGGSGGFSGSSARSSSSRGSSSMGGGGGMSRGGGGGGGMSRGGGGGGRRR
jgi:hypothetical protein